VLLPLLFLYALLRLARRAFAKAELPAGRRY
jgi:hypothetical protein